METYRSYEKKGLSYSRICRLFLAGALLVWLIRVAVAAVTIIWLCGQPESAIQLTETENAYRFDMILGYAQCGWEHLPGGAEIVSSKRFCIVFVFFSSITRELPVLLLLGYLRRILNVIRDSHSPFVSQTAEYTGKIGWLLVLTGVFGKWIFQMGMGLLVYHQPYFVNPLEFSWIFAGVIVLLTSDILRWGCELQEFSDETL